MFNVRAAGRLIGLEKVRVDDFLNRERNRRKAFVWIMID